MAQTKEHYSKKGRKFAEAKETMIKKAKEIDEKAKQVFSGKAGEEDG